MPDGARMLAQSSPIQLSKNPRRNQPDQTHQAVRRFTSSWRLELSNQTPRRREQLGHNKQITLTNMALSLPVSRPAYKHRNDKCKCFSNPSKRSPDFRRTRSQAQEVRRGRHDLTVHTSSSSEIQNHRGDFERVGSLLRSISKTQRHR
jgi:hypothetical protein